MQVKKTRNELLAAINAAGRRFSMVTVLFHQTVAERSGLSGADHKYLDLLFQEGPMTAGRLAQLTGLTTGAITGIVDRLEKQGFVKRAGDPSDRRKVLIVPQANKATRRLAPVFDALSADLAEAYNGFSAEKLEIILEYLQTTTAVLEKKALALRAGRS